MNRRNFLVSLLGNLACLLLAGCGRGSRSESDNAPEPASDQPSAEVIAYEKQNQKLMKHADRVVEEQRQRGEAMAQTEAFRTHLQLDTAAAWSRFINAHLPTFQALRRQALQSPFGRIQCTICNGRGQMDFCLLCNSTGKCPTCQGTGRLNNNDICPTCLGNGKCFHCFGTGKMPCPFCDDGIITAQTPTPPNLMPIGG
jgi:hypothetical protein